MGKWYELEVIKVRTFLVEVEHYQDESDAEARIRKEASIDEDETVEAFDVKPGEKLRELLAKTPDELKFKL